MTNTATGHTSNKNTNKCDKLKSERERARERENSKFRILFETERDNL